MGRMAQIAAELQEAARLSQTWSKYPDYKKTRGVTRVKEGIREIWRICSLPKKYCVVESDSKAFVPDDIPF